MKTEDGAVCQVYLNEYNPFIGNAAYLPLTSGKLQAYALTCDDIAKQYQFMPYLFHIDTPIAILNQYDNPGIAAFSAAIWNEQLCLHVAREVKQLWPECLIIFGGTQVPHNPVAYMERHPFIDIAVRGEGEEPFKQVLHRYLSSREFSGIEGVTWRNLVSGKPEYNSDSVRFEKELDVYPSPYLMGLYDSLVQSRQDLKFQTIIETNRGCPFACTFCYWGKGGLSRKYRFFSLERVAAEIDWIGKNHIGFVYNADSNFGMHRRDEEIADLLVAARRSYGYPEKVVNLYGKNTDMRIYEIAKKLYLNGMHKGLGLSRQSMDQETLAKTKRGNIKISVYKSLQEKFESDGIPTFCELILGLPGETYESFSHGISELLEASLTCQLIIVLCEIYPNTEMGDPAYIKRHGIMSKRNVSYGVHSVIQDEKWVTEYIDYVIGTECMPTDQWKKAGKLAWTTMALTSLRLGYYILHYLHQRFGIRYIDIIEFMAQGKMQEGTGQLWLEELLHYEAFMEQLIAGRGRAVMLTEFGDIYWAIEESSFLRIANQAEQFYKEMVDIVGQFLGSKGIAYDQAELDEAVKYQFLRVPTPKKFQKSDYVFQFNFPEYFEKMSSLNPINVTRESQRLFVKEEVHEVDKMQFAQERLLWGRRGGKFERSVGWEKVTKDPDPSDESIGADLEKMLFLPA
jgi:radical SAM superfamily enzyme YgiQ (UPF0313 family)